MTGFQKGDYIFSFEGKPVYLRLTLGALAEICARLNVENIAELSTRIRMAKKPDIAIIFSALSRPAHADYFDFFAINLSKAMPALADIFEINFAPLSAGGPL